MNQDNGAIWLRHEGDHVIVCIEHNGKWIELIREYSSAPFSHIVEPGGIRNKIMSNDYQC